MLRLLALVVLFSAPAVYESTHLSALTCSEVWVHLRTGTWMLENHPVPRTGLFSQYSNLVWNDSSWGFDLLLGTAYRIFGLRAIPILLMLLKTAVAAVAFLLAYSGRDDLLEGGRAIGPGTVGRFGAAAASIRVFDLFFLRLKLQLLLSSRHSGSARRLYWLPLLFLLWANLHIQFVAGLVLLGLFVVASLVEHSLRVVNVTRLSPRIVPLPLIQVCTIAVLCVLATFATPYGFRLLPDFLKSQYSEVGFVHFSETAADGAWTERSDHAPRSLLGVPREVH